MHIPDVGVRGFRLKDEFYAQFVFVAVCVFGRFRRFQGVARRLMLPFLAGL